MGNRISSTVYRLGISQNWDNHTNLQEKQFLKYYDAINTALIKLKKHTKFNNAVYDFNFYINSKLFIEIDFYSLYFTIYKSNSTFIKKINEILIKEFNKRELTVQNLSFNFIKPNINSAAYIAAQFEQSMLKRKKYKNVIKLLMAKPINMGISGIQVWVAGRLNGAEIARQEKFILGKVPLSSIKYQIDYCHLNVNTKEYGTIGIKVWVNFGLYTNENLYK